LAVQNFRIAIQEFTVRLGTPPYCTVEETYALWRTDQVNLSISVNPSEAGQLRHLGFEDPAADSYSEETDSNGFVWERFSNEHQRGEILKYWPHAKFRE
jgi:hypothetical protein